VKITESQLKQIIAEETKNVLLNRSLLNEDWNKILGDTAVVNTAIEKLKNIQTGEIKNLLDDNEYLKKFLVLLYYTDEYKKMEGEGGYGEDLEKYLPPGTIDKLESDAKVMAIMIEKHLIHNPREMMGYYPLYTFLSDLSGHEVKSTKDFKKEFQKAGEESTKVAKLGEGKEK
jgi:hypothetical protein